MATYQMPDELRDEFNPDPDLNDHDEQALTADQVEERMNVVLEAWGWTEERRDDALYGLDDDDAEQWEVDTDRAYSLAVSAPSGTPLAIFTAILEAKGWPKRVERFQDA